MNFKIKKIGVASSIILINVLLWNSFLNKESPTEIQNSLYKEAEEKIEDKIYIKAIPLLEEAITIDGENTKEIEEVAKDLYLMLIDQREYEEKYINLLNTQIERDQDIDAYLDLANFYITDNSTKDALDLLNDGILKTDNERLKKMYEENKYSYTLSRYLFEDVNDGFGKYISVKNNNNWGLAKSYGEVILPMNYEKIGTFTDEKVIVKEKNDIFVINIKGNRVAVFDENVEDFGNTSGEITPLKIDGKWTFSDANGNINSIRLDKIGTFNNNIAPSKQEDKWGFIDKAGEWYIEPVYDDIKVNGLGMAYAQKTFFAEKNNKIIMNIDGVEKDINITDAKPFNNVGYATVKKDGKWGFVDDMGNIVIDFLYDDALSFRDGLAAIKVDEMWGYINLNGDIVIEPLFEEVKSFNNGCAPVKNDGSWKMLNLNYYK